MHTKAIVSCAAAAAAVVMAARADAQTARSERRTYFTERVPAPADALELTLGTGWTQGFGMLQSGVALPDVASAGVGVDVGLDHRATPHLAWGVSGQYQELDAVRGTGARGLTTGLDVTYHARPMERLDPWVQLGPGYRLLWETRAGAPTTVTHGFELARLRVGVDVRTGDDVALGPVIGGDLDVFLWQKAGDAPSAALAAPRVSTFVFGGVQGRFDLGGERWASRPGLLGAR